VLAHELLQLEALLLREDLNSHLRFSPFPVALFLLSAALHRVKQQSESHLPAVF